MRVTNERVHFIKRAARTAIGIAILFALSTPAAAQDETITDVEAALAELVRQIESERSFQQIESAPSSQPTLKIALKLSDLRAGQPAVGKDQIAYKVGRFDGVVWPDDVPPELNGGLESGPWYSNDEKMFEDVAGSNGQSARKDQKDGDGEQYKTEVDRKNILGDDAFPGDPDHPASSYSVTFDGPGGDLDGKLVLPGNNPDDMKTVVIAPDRNYYLTDGHHTTLLYSQMRRGGAQGRKIGEFTLYLGIDGDYSNLADANASGSAMDEFWVDAANDGKVWLKLLNDKKPGYSYLPGVDGLPDQYKVRSVDLAKFNGSLPDSMELGEFSDDPYRGILYFCRGIGWDKPVGTAASGLPFLEFYWAEEIQNGIASGLTRLDLHTPASPYNLADLRSYTQAVKAISEWMVGLDPDEPIGSSGFTAKQMGQAKEFGQKDFDQLIDASETGKPLKPKNSDDPRAGAIGKLPKPGKWAYSWASQYAAVPLEPAPAAPAQ